MYCNCNTCKLEHDRRYYFQGLLVAILPIYMCICVYVFADVYTVHVHVAKARTRDQVPGLSWNLGPRVVGIVEDGLAPCRNIITHGDFLYGRVFGDDVIINGYVNGEAPIEFEGKRESMATFAYPRSLSVFSPCS
jgi:hypothetical protein